MYSVSFLLLVLSVQTNALFSNKDRWCGYMFKQKYPENDYNIVRNDSAFINYCTAEDVPYDIHFTVMLDYDKKGATTDAVQVEFASPKRECKYGITLLVNPLIKDEKDCQEYNFEQADDINWKIHSLKADVCVFKNTNQSTFSKYNDNSITIHLYKDKIYLLFKYIFAGCYALRFHLDHRKYVIREPIFLNTTYERVEAEKPQVICRYKDIEYSNLEKRRVKNFTLDVIDLQGDTGNYLNLALVSPQNKDLTKNCIWQEEPLLYTWEINLTVDKEQTLQDQHCNVKLEKPTINGKYVKKIWCNFQIETHTEDHCFLYHLIDDRCQHDTTNGTTIWNPYYALNKIPCLWVQHCVKIPDHDESMSRKLKSDKMLSASSYLLLPIIAIVFIISAVIGILCFWHYSRIRQEEVNLYVNPQHDSDCPKSTDFDIVDNISEKGINHGNLCNDIVLLYTNNNSTSFMTLMKDFRETLAKMCSCAVHDWHNGALWNEVAKVGAVSWFTELLNNECHVIWIDTSVTRSVISNSRNNESSLDKLSKYYEIHDFRDMAFRAVLEVAKNEMNNVTHQYRRHFVVRFEGLESTANMNDPFLELSPHVRYYMPQHLMQLCSDLSVMKPEISKYKMKVEEDLYRIFVYQLYKSQTQQRLKFMKMESII